MDANVSFVIVAGICGIVFLIILLKQRAQFLLAFLVRVFLGATGIYFINDLLAEQGIMISVGLNPVSLLTVGTLGIGGLALLYGIVVCDFL